MKILISDIDGTLIDRKKRFNKKDFQKLSQKLSENKIELIYSSGRSKKLILDFLKRYNLPLPKTIITHVGTIIYHRKFGLWKKDKAYTRMLSKCWKKMNSSKINEILKQIKELKEQEKESQSQFKVSYYLDKKYKEKNIVKKIEKILESKDIEAKVVYSFHKLKKIGLVDVVPKNSGKKGAIDYLSKKYNIGLEDIIYAGDSGNDLDALKSGCKGVLVGNSRNQIKTVLKNKSKNIYISKQKYIKGIIEGGKRFGFWN